MNELTIKPDSTDVTINAQLHDDTTGAAKTGVTITDIDMTYIRSGAAAVKNDATALGSPSAAHADNKAIEIDSTNADGLYRFDWPDAAFASGVEFVTLVIKCSGVVTKQITISLATANANAKEISDDATAADNLELIIENAKGADHKMLISSDAQDLSASLSVNTKKWAGTAVTVGAGLPNVNIEAVNASAEAADSLQVAAARLGNKVTQDRTTGTMTVRNFADNADLYTVTLVTVAGVVTRGKAT